MADGTTAPTPAPAPGIDPAPPGRALWRGPEIARTNDWLFHLSDAAVAEIHARMEPFRGRGISPDGLVEADFPTPVLTREMAPLAREIGDDGLGFAVLRGVPVEFYAGLDLEILHWALGKAVGAVVTQGGSLGYIAHVTDQGIDAQKAYYAQLGGPLPMHMDPIDVAALLCLKTARDGGTNLLVSSAALHNHLLARHPEILERLYTGFFHASQPAESGDPQICRQRLPIFFRHNGRIHSTYLPAPIHRAVESGMAELNAGEREALEVLDREALSAELVVAIDSKPGDAVFLNNRTVLHSRTDYKDFETPGDRRHLLRVWMHMRGWNPMPNHAYHYTLAENSDEKIFLPDFLDAE